MCDKKKKKNKKTKKLIQFLKSHISGTREAISLKFGMWSAAVGGNVHSKNRFVSSRKHRATEVRKLRFLSSCQYTHGCYAPASWAARHTTVCLDIYIYIYKAEKVSVGLSTFLWAISLKLCIMKWVLCFTKRSSGFIKCVKGSLLLLSFIIYSALNARV